MWWDLCDRFCHSMMLKAVEEGSIAPNLRQSCAKYIGTLTKKNKNWFMNLKCLPCLQNQCWVSIWWLWVLGTQIWDNLNFLKKFEKFNFFEKNWNETFLPAPHPPVSMLAISEVQDTLRPTLIMGGGVFHFFINCPKYFAHDCLSFGPKAGILQSPIMAFWCPDFVEICFMHGQRAWKRHSMRSAT